MVVVFLMLTAYFQSIKLAFVSVATTPAVVAGVAFALYITHTTLNIQSFMGAIMAVGVAVANAILLVTFAENARQTGIGAAEGARTGAEERLRPILMTSCAMIAGMVPMALGLGEGGEQSAPLGRAVIGGLSVATGATLLILPAVFTVVMGSSQNRLRHRSIPMTPMARITLRNPRKERAITTGTNIRRPTPRKSERRRRKVLRGPKDKMSMICPRHSLAKAAEVCLGRNQHCPEQVRIPQMIRRKKL